MADKNIHNEDKLTKKEKSITHYTVLSIFFICVTIAAIVFYNANILYWYLLGALMEIFYRIPIKPYEKDDTVNLDYRRYYEKNSDKYRG